MPSIFKSITATAAVILFAGTAQAAEIKVDIQGFKFKPAQINVSVGDTVAFTNRDGAPHTASAVDGSFETGTLSKGKSKSIAFDSAGTYAFFCAIHPKMKATVVVK
uniref:cupredoxin domain-containing protein n=1 Tax=Pararhizobium sp. IMCC3301 TaxID=3067904 RepID=UPI0027410D03|nr:cupredoxin family copper-binding protein [Pararhizobium sp. IMCC3301]